MCGGCDSWNWTHWPCVTAVRAENWTESYTYDQAGNLTHCGDTRAPEHATAGQRTAAGTLLRQAGRTTADHTLLRL